VDGLLLHVSLGGIAFGAQVIRFFLHIFSISVCLTFAKICALCLNWFTDFDAIWWVHLWGPTTNCISWRLGIAPGCPQGKSERDI